MPPQAGPPLNVICVDDEISLLRIMKDDIESLGHNVTACDGASAAILAVQSQGFDIAFLDIKMPGMEGLELLTLFRELTPETDVVIVTGVGTKENAIEALRCGAIDFREKPIQYEDTKEVLRQAVERRSTRSATQSDHASAVRQDSHQNTSPLFDLFLSHNSRDKPDVRRLAEALKKRNLRIWLDEWELRPGVSWLDELERIIEQCNSAAVCVGGSGIGPWEDREMKALLRRFADQTRNALTLPIIPVLLPGAPMNVQMPLFLEEFTWVDLRDGIRSEKVDLVEWGITGINPSR